MGQNIKPKFDLNLETCVETYDPSDGRLRINPCDKSNQNTFNKFRLERIGLGYDGDSGESAYTYKIHSDADFEYCATNVGTIGENGDHMRLLECKDRDDFIWTATVIDTADFVC
eukprot:15327593-Ditylum_brightwellii.AAC.1